MTTSHPAPEGTPAVTPPADTAALAPAAALPDRQRPPLTRAGAWVGWHAVELTALGLPLAAAVLINRWLALAATPGALLWAAHALRAHRARTRTADPAAQEGDQA